MFARKAQRIRALEAQVQEQEAVHRSLIARVYRLEREVEDARSDSRNRERAQAFRAAGLRE
jgi:cell division protein FtsB